MFCFIKPIDDNYEWFWAVGTASLKEPKKSRAKPLFIFRKRISNFVIDKQLIEKAPIRRHEMGKIAIKMTKKMVCNKVSFSLSSHQPITKQGGFTKARLSRYFHNPVRSFCYELVQQIPLMVSPDERFGVIRH